MAQDGNVNELCAQLNLVRLDSLISLSSLPLAHEKMSDFYCAVIEKENSSTCNCSQ